MPADLSAFNAVSAAVVVAAALGVSWFFVRLYGPPPDPGRYATLDGLRGFLVLFVFVHHAGIWLSYNPSRVWLSPSSPLFTHFGESSVGMFFMITSFLFTSKLLDGPPDWIHIFTSRFLRLVPLYLFAMALMFVIVAVESGFALREPLPELVSHALRWLGFTIAGNPNVNAMPRTFVITSGATWSLPFEWLFYSALPMLALVVSSKRDPFAALASAACFGLLWWTIEPVRFPVAGMFAGGIVAALAVRRPQVREAMAGPVGNALALPSLVAVVLLYPDASHAGAVVLLSVAFLAIAAGNPLFGALTWAPSRLLGAIGYSIYLLHGIVLFVAFEWLESSRLAATNSVLAHWTIVLGAVFPLVALCYLTFYRIELPAMRSARGVQQRIRLLSQRGPVPASEAALD